MKISMIAAIGEGNRVLGKDNKLIWSIPEDIKFFRDATRGHTVIMGRKTFESMGKPLPQRMNIIISRNETFHPEGVILVYSLEDALKVAKSNEKQEIFIIGGGKTYKEGIKFADRLYLTIVHGKYDGDAFFPDYSDFKKVVSKRESTGNGYEYTFLTLERNR